eukprot:6020280-Prymnesium_polylepis.1
MNLWGTKPRSCASHVSSSLAPLVDARLERHGCSFRLGRSAQKLEQHKVGVALVARRQPEAETAQLLQPLVQVVEARRHLRHLEHAARPEQPVRLVKKVRVVGAQQGEREDDGVQGTARQRHVGNIARGDALVARHQVERVH